VVFLTAGGWSERIVDAAVAGDVDESARLLAVAAAAVAAREVVGAAVADVTLTERGPWPLRLKDRIRAGGPTTGHSLPGQRNFQSPSTSHSAP